MVDVRRRTAQNLHAGCMSLAATCDRLWYRGRIVIVVIVIGRAVRCSMAAGFQPLAFLSTVLLRILVGLSNL